jgi:hypothetical protein
MMAPPDSARKTATLHRTHAGAALRLARGVGASLQACAGCRLEGYGVPNVKVGSARYMEQEGIARAAAGHCRSNAAMAYKEAGLRRPGAPAPIASDWSAPTQPLIIDRGWDQKAAPRLDPATDAIGAFTGTASSARRTSAPAGPWRCRTAGRRVSSSQGRARSRRRVPSAARPVRQGDPQTTAPHARSWSSQARWAARRRRCWSALRMRSLTCWKGKGRAGSMCSQSRM